MREPRKAQLRRRVRWKRVFLLLFVLLLLFVAIAGAAKYVYTTLFHTSAPVISQTGRLEVKGNQINVLLLGIDDGDDENPGSPQRSDTMIVASINLESGGVGLLSIPRDTRVEIPGHKRPEKITHAFFYGGSDLAVKTVENVINVPINYSVVIDWQGFIKIIDLLGGVNLYVENDMNYEDPYANLHIHLIKGYQHLDGQRAGEYVRFRSDELGDIGRVQRQQRFLKALTEELLQVGNIIKLPLVAHSAKQYVDTDMTFFTALKIAYHLKSLKINELHTQMLPGNFATIDGISFWVPNKEQVQLLVERL
jgi:polyisoprenyl-teichoic acid--peptidoglycan teichoic acid transferase